MRYLVTETVAYTVEATSLEEAITHVVDDAARNEHCFYAVTERSAEAIPEPAAE